MGDAKTKRGKPERSRWLALIPITVGVVFGAFLLPRAVPPDDVPLPIIDERRVAHAERVDDDRAARALDGDVRVLGTAIRNFDTAEAKDDPRTEWSDLRVAIDSAIPPSLRTSGFEGLRRLRAMQLARFLDEVATLRSTGQATPELDAVGGSFVRSMKAAGWVDEKGPLMNAHELRVAFKLKWNALLHMDDVPELALETDELRVLYAFYLRNPHAPDQVRANIEAARKTASTPQACEALRAGERIAIESWRLDKMEKLARLDSSYPITYARGISLYRMGNFLGATAAFEEQLKKHPDGPYTLRTKNFLRASREH